ncbi:hypothetical protein Taro_042102 [Colocasia esculenta]|uniref:Acid phosphatase/vanadium-dependent haloperoxidase-related protein n=1 Tax=Colocasia esculenta TaxID=4460 RepID=A0A843WD31_COLES|nr:hypothetical protein [Colocasia esculenta]
MATDGGVTSSSSLSSSGSDAASAASLSSVFHNYPLFSAMIAFAIAQSTKLFTTWYKERRWDAKQLIGSGGMPSSHSATVTALAVAVGLQEGFGGSVFATSMIVACVVSANTIVVRRSQYIYLVMYDAFSVRLQAGRQAEVLNQIVFELPPEHPLADTRPLRELLGHTPLQVIAGAVLGCVTAIIARVISVAGS